MNGNLWVWSARPKIPSLRPRRGAGEGVGIQMWSVLENGPKKSLLFGGQRMQPLSLQLLLASALVSSSTNDMDVLVPTHIVILCQFQCFGCSTTTGVPGRRNCRSHDPSDISNMFQMGEFSQMACISVDQTNHRPQPRDVGEAPIRGPASTGTKNVTVIFAEW